MRGRAERIAVDRNGHDVLADGRLPFGALAETDHQLAKRRSPVLIGGLTKSRAQVSDGSAEGPCRAQKKSPCWTNVVIAINNRVGVKSERRRDSTYARGLDGTWGMYAGLDRAPKGRNETGPWWRRNDECGKH